MSLALIYCFGLSSRHNGAYWLQSALYFVVTGIQLWITAYLVKYISPLYGGFTKSEVVYAFAFTSATGPILYVLLKLK